MTNNEIIAYTAAVLTPLGTGGAFFLNWWLKKGKQEAELEAKVEAQATQIGIDIASKYADRITRLESQVSELFTALLARTGEVGELRGQVTILREQLEISNKDKSALHIEVASLRAQVAGIKKDAEP